MASTPLLGPAAVREIAAALGVSPTKKLGQNFVIDAATVRKIVADSGVTPSSRVLEVGPGLGSLTLGLLEAGAIVSAVEIDPVLAQALPETVRAHQPAATDRFAVRRADALSVRSGADLEVPPAVLAQASLEEQSEMCFAPTHLVANLPYNVAVPVLLTLLETLPSLESVTVMVQSEVADRLAAQPGSKAYGVPSVKAAWYGEARRGAKISRSIFWPVPNVDSALVHIDVAPVEQRPRAEREAVFGVIDAAFSQRRKMLRSALAQWAGSAAEAEHILQVAGVDPQLRGEKVALCDFVAIAKARR